MLQIDNKIGHMEATMLRKLSKKTHAFFSSGRLPSTHIKIYLDEVEHNKYIEPTDRIKAFHDKNDQCMHAIIEDFAITETDQIGFKRNQFQIEFHLKDMSELKVQIDTKEPMDVTMLDNEYLVCKCAAESLMKLLYQRKLISNDLISFEGSRGNHLTDQFSIHTTRLRMNNNSEGVLSTSNDLISVVQAKLLERKIFVLLNATNKNKLNEVCEVFAELFKEREFLPEADRFVVNL